MKKYLELTLNGKVMRGYENIIDKNKCMVMFHGFTGNKTETNRMFYNIDKLLETQKFSSLRFDWYGHGESDFDLSQITVGLLLKQAKYILEYANKKYKEVYLLGFSMGGALAINSLQTKPKKLILISPAINMLEKVNSYYNNNEKINECIVDFHGLKLSKKFVKSFEKLEFENNLRNFNQPILLIHGTKDISVPISNSNLLYTKFKKGKFVKIKGADHGYSKVEYMNKINQLILNFI
ncbi:MAG: alpha/beta hydrolase [Bacillota bacterium]